MNVTAQRGIVSFSHVISLSLFQGFKQLQGEIVAFYRAAQPEMNKFTEKYLNKPHEKLHIRRAALLFPHTP